MFLTQPTIEYTIVHMANLTELEATTTDPVTGFVADHIGDSLLNFTLFVAVDDPGPDNCEPHTEFWGRDEWEQTSIVVTHRRPECGDRIYPAAVCDCCLSAFLRELRQDGAIDITVLVPATAEAVA